MKLSLIITALVLVGPVLASVPAGGESGAADRHARDASPAAERPVLVRIADASVSPLHLLLAAEQEGVDWAAGKIRVTGIGMPPANAASPTIRRELAERAALSDAERKLVKAVSEIKVGSDGNVRSHMGERDFTEKIQGYIKGYHVTGERERDDGGIEIDVELPLNGQNGLSRQLFE
ncbi:MAG TPA: hypothetical protein VL197_05125 [Nitrospirota bacterium]|nr:hypothetical protein [Nitrospirota bacterium]